MKMMKKLLPLTLALLILISLFAGLSASAEDYSYKVRLYQGLHGTLPGGSPVEQTFSGSDVSFDISGIEVDDAKYEAIGVRESGKDYYSTTSYVASGGTVSIPASRITRDTDYVVAYGLKGDQLKLTIVCKNSSGTTLKTDTFLVPRNSTVMIRAPYVENYNPPKTYLSVSMKTQDETKTVTYTAASTTSTTTSRSTTTSSTTSSSTTTNRTTSTGTTSTGTTTNRSTTASGTNPTTGSTTSGSIPPANNSLSSGNSTSSGSGSSTSSGSGTSSGSTVVSGTLPTPGAGVVATKTLPQAEDVLDLDEPSSEPTAASGGTQASSLAATSLSTKPSFPTWAYIVAAALLLALVVWLFWFLLFYRKRKRMDEEDFDFDFNEQDDNKKTV